MPSPRNPHGILWDERADPHADWAITRQQPIASLLVEGVIPAFTRSRRPPPTLMGKTLTIHAGTGEVALKRIDDASRHALANDQRLHDARGGSPEPDPSQSEAARGSIPQEPWRETLTRLPHGCLVGRARLIAAYPIGNVVWSHGVPTVYADLRERGMPEKLGRWPDFRTWAGPMAGDWSRGRWVWMFEDPVAFRLGAKKPVKGFGGLWRLDRGLALRARQAEAELYHQQVEEQEARRA